jgi:hypothetical protein
MSDDNKPQDEAPIKEQPNKLRGFADPKNRKNINRGGRKKGSVSVVPSTKDIEDGFLKSNTKALNKILEIMENGSESNQLKAAFKIADTNVQIVKERNQIKVKKQNAKTGEKESYEVEKATGTDGGNVVKFISTTYNEEGKDSEEEKED